MSNKYTPALMLVESDCIKDKYTNNKLDCVGL